MRLIDADSIKWHRTTECGGHGVFLTSILCTKRKLTLFPPSTRKACARAERGRAQRTGTRTENSYMTPGRVASAAMPSIQMIPMT